MKALDSYKKAVSCHDMRTAPFWSRTSLYECACPCDCDCKPSGGGNAYVLDRPVSFYLELTPDCNNRCMGCGNVFERGRSGLRPRSLLETDQWLALLEHIAPGTNRIILTGGEPTLFSRFSEIVSRIDELGVEYTVFTNGRWLDPQHLLEYLAKSSHFRGFLISLHGPAPAIHEAFCGIQGAFKETVANVRRAAAVGLVLTISTVINRFNHACLHQTVDFALSLGANHVVFNRYVGMVPELLVDEMNLVQAVNVINQMAHDGTPVSFGNCIPQCFAESTATGCSAGDTFCTIDPWGNVRPCNHAPMIVGSLLRQTVGQVWHSSKMNLWRTMVPGPCTQCAAFAECHGGCRAMAMLSNEPADPLMKVPLADQVSTRRYARLPQDTIPVRCFTTRRESQGYLLMRGSHTFMLPWSHKKLVEYLDGNFSIGQIESACGSHVLPLVESLHHNGFVELTG